MARQYRLSAVSLGAATRKAAELYGPAARIVSADRVLDPGFAGLLGRRHVEATVLVPDRGDPADPVSRADGADPAGGASPSFVPHALPASIARRAGIAALLEDAVRAEAALRNSPPVSTEAEGFDAVLERLRGEVEENDDDVVPALLNGPGDLVLVVGPGAAVYDVVLSMVGSPARWELTRAGEGGEGWAGLTGPRDANVARARAVESGKAVLVACPLRPLEDVPPQLTTAASLRADQVWLAVDARHKADETAEWVDAVAERLPVHALAVIGASETRTPFTVNVLGFPVGWVDGLPAPRTVL